MAEGRIRSQTIWLQRPCLWPPYSYSEGHCLLPSPAHMTTIIVSEGGQAHAWGLGRKFRGCVPPQGSVGSVHTWICVQSQPCPHPSPRTLGERLLPLDLFFSYPHLLMPNPSPIFSLVSFLLLGGLLYVWNKVGSRLDNPVLPQPASYVP